MSTPMLHDGDHYTYKDYLTWPIDERWELIHGKAYNMSPAPSTLHQRLVMRISSILYNYLEGKPCEVFIAPFDVRLTHMSLNNEEDIDTIIQPDITIVCDKTKIDEKGCNGSPDMVVEVISPSTMKKDMRDKLFLYQQHGIKEYWLVLPKDQTILVYKKTDDGVYEAAPEVYDSSDELTPSILPDLTISLDNVFKDLQ